MPPTGKAWNLGAGCDFTSSTHEKSHEEEKISSSKTVGEYVRYRRWWFRYMICNIAGIIDMLRKDLVSGKMVFEVVNIFHRTHFLLILCWFSLAKFPKRWSQKAAGFLMFHPLDLLRLQAGSRKICKVQLAPESCQREPWAIRTSETHNDAGHLRGEGGPHHACQGCGWPIPKSWSMKLQGHFRAVRLKQPSNVPFHCVEIPSFAGGHLSPLFQIRGGHWWPNGTMAGWLRNTFCCRSSRRSGSGPFRSLEYQATSVLEGEILAWARRHSRL